MFPLPKSFPFLKVHTLRVNYVNSDMKHQVLGTIREIGPV